MSRTINELIEKIKTSVFGKDVRQSICDGITIINEKVDENTNQVNKTKNAQNQLERIYNAQIAELANQNPQLPEIVDARQGFDTIGALLKRKIFHFSDVESMKNCLTLFSGDVVQTLGYYEADDGGAGLYRIVNDANILDDGGSVIGLTNGLKAKLIILDELNIKQFGAYGDNYHNDTTIIQTALSLYNNIYFPEGSYLIDDTIIINSNKKIKIDGNIVYAGPKDRPAILIKNRYNNIELKDIVDVESYNNVNYSEGWHGWEDSNYAAIELQDVSYSNIKFKRIVNFTTGVKINGLTVKGTFKTFIEGYSITDCKYGIYFVNTNPSWINNCKIKNIMINYATSSGNFYNNANPITTYGVYQEKNNNDTYGMRFMEFNNLFFETTKKDNFIGFYFNLIGKSQFNMCIPEIKNGTVYAYFDMKYIVENVVSPENHSYENIFYDCRQMYGSNNDIIFANTGKIVCSLPQIAKHNNTNYNKIFEDNCLVGKAGMVTNNKSNVRGYGVTFLTSSTLTLNDYQLIRTNSTRAITNDFDNHYLDIPSSYPLALMLKVSLNETYKIKVGPNGNVAIKLFNSNGDMIDGIVDNVKKLGGYFGYNPNYKNITSLSGPLNDFEFTVIDENVAYVLLMIYNQVNNIEISKFNALGDVIKLAPYLAHISQLGDVNCSDVKPTTDTTNGAYVGQTFYKSLLANLGEKWVFNGSSWS